MPKIDKLDAPVDAMTTILTTNLDNQPKLCPRYTKGMLMIYPIYAKDMLKMCPRYAQDMPKIRQNMPKICPRYAPYTPNIYDQDISFSSLTGGFRIQYTADNRHVRTNRQKHHHTKGKKNKICSQM